MQDEVPRRGKRLRTAGLAVATAGLLAGGVLAVRAGLAPTDDGGQRAGATSPSADPPDPTGGTASAAAFPNASSTGAHGALTRQDGNRTITRDGTVLKDLELHGSLLIEADDVTLDNVKVVSRDYWPVRITGSGATLEDTTIIGGKESQASLAGPFVGRRLDLSGAPDGIKMTDGGELYDSYIHDLGELDGAHNDAIDASGPVEIVHNTILNQVGQTSAIFLSDYGEDPDTHVLIQDNLLGGGGYSIYGGAPDTAQGHRVVDNLFTTRFFPRSGYWGPVAYWRARGNTWSNNRWADGPEAGDLVAP